MSLNFQDTLKKAEAGDIDAQYAIATAFFEGEEIAEDYAQAINWFRKAAESGHAESAYTMGRMCLRGMGLKEDPSEAAKWFTKALAHGLGLWYVWCDAVSVGDAYYFGRSGVAIDYAEAFRWYRVAADGGPEYAMVKVGIMYAAGEGVLKDDAEAARWYRKAANLGDWEGWYKLGMCYKDGVGVEKDSQEAEKWFLLAARKNHEDAQYALGLMLVAGDAVDDCGCDEEYWLGMAAEKGHVMAQFALGEIYESRARYASACAWYRKAADQGHSFAQYLLGARYYFGEGVPRNKINAYVYWSLAGFTEDARAKLVVLEKEMTAKQLAAGQRRLIRLRKVIALKLAAKQASE